jgi:hypothetical protein
MAHHVHLATRFLKFGTSIFLAVLFSTMLVSAQGGGPAGPLGPNLTDGIQSAQGTANAGLSVRAPLLSQAPELTSAQAAERETLLAKSGRTGPAGSTKEAPVNQNRGPEAALPQNRPQSGLAAAMQPSAASAPGDFSLFRVNGIPSSGIAGGYNYSSYTMEPSTANNGQYVFQTGNWYATRSFDNGATWSYLNPFSLFGSGFCCDQVTVLDAGRNRQFWLLQFGDHLVLANSAGRNLSSWCYWNITPAWAGFNNATDSFDYNDIALSRNYLYIATNVFRNTGGAWSTVIRLPIDPMIACAGFGYNFYTRNDVFTDKLVQGASDTMYWATNWYPFSGGSNGSWVSVFSWPENAGVSVTSRNISAFNFMYRNSGQNCGSPDGVVKNWCQFADSRVLGGALGKGVLQFSWNVSQGSGYNYPWTYRVYIREFDKAWLGSNALAAGWGAFQFTSLAPNARGDIGMETAWGGGSNDYYPGSAVLIDDDYGWNINYYLWGQGNTCTYGGLYRWGDYLTTRAFEPVRDAWIAAGYAIWGGNCGAGGYAYPVNLVFGRGRDTASVVRWWGY